MIDFKVGDILIRLDHKSKIVISSIKNKDYNVKYLSIYDDHINSSDYNLSKMYVNSEYKLSLKTVLNKL